MSISSLGRALSLGIPLLAASCSGAIVNGSGTLSDADGGTDAGIRLYAPIQVPGCVGACSINYDCPASSGPTTLTGTVTIPSGALPLYNARVFIPSGTELPEPPATGAACDRCDAAVSAVASTTTDISGRFTLTHVPSGSNIPLVIKVGKWRKVITLADSSKGEPPITDCTTTALAPEATRLPRNRSEGNIPRIALSVGNADALECILRNKKLGLDDSEFTNETGDGRVNLYAGANGVKKYASTLNGGASFTAGSTTAGKSWWDDIANWRKYDIVMLSCEGGQHMEYKSAQALQNLETYVGMGGRVFASHWHNGWIQNAATSQKIRSVVTSWNSPGGPDSTTENIDLTFAKGLALADWLMLPAVSGSTTRGQLAVDGAKYTVSTIDPALTQRWISYQPSSGAALPQYFSFNAPVGAASADQCGQMVFTDLHVSSGTGGDTSPSTGAFPTQCTANSLSPQEKALIFMLFDLTNCLQPVVG